MTKKEKLTKADFEDFNANCNHMSDGERLAFLHKVARVESSEPLPADRMKELMKLMARQVRGKGVARTQIAADAAAVAHFGWRARRAVAYKRTAERHFAAARPILARYHLEVVQLCGPRVVPDRAMGTRRPDTPADVSGSRDYLLIA